MEYSKSILVCFFIITFFSCKSDKSDVVVLSSTSIPVLEESNTKPVADSARLLAQLVEKEKTSKEIVAVRNAVEPTTKKEESTKQEPIRQQSQKKQTKKEVPKPVEKVIKQVSAPKMVFQNLEYDFGRIVQGEKVQYEFVFKNSGKQPLVIKNAEASCGCTQPLYPFMPIEPGESGKIAVQFNSTGRLGRQSPTIKVFSNSSASETVLHLKGEVVTKDFSNSN